MSEQVKPRKPWMYVREAWKETELLCADRDVLRIWVLAFEDALAAQAAEIERLQAENEQLTAEKEYRARMAAAILKSGGEKIAEAYREQLAASDAGGKTTGDY